VGLANHVILVLNLIKCGIDAVFDLIVELVKSKRAIREKFPLDTFNF
jgi:hypothetical protein